MLKINLQLFAQDRILGSSCTIDIYTSTGPVPFGEVDSFTAEPEHEIKKFQPLGEVGEHYQPIYRGYKLSFKGGKINGDFEKIQEAIDNALLAGKQVPRYRIVETTTYYDGTVEKWIYDNALLHNLKTDKSSAADEVKQDFTGQAKTKIRG